jgi:CheY-like chemotaxis protein/nitrogen-specific signal transduction histidine kinase
MDYVEILNLYNRRGIGVKQTEEKDNSKIKNDNIFVDKIFEQLNNYTHANHSCLIDVKASEKNFSILKKKNWESENFLLFSSKTNEWYSNTLKQFIDIGLSRSETIIKHNNINTPLIRFKKSSSKNYSIVNKHITVKNFLFCKIYDDEDLIFIFIFLNIDKFHHSHSNPDSILNEKIHFDESNHSHSKSDSLLNEKNCNEHIHSHSKSDSLINDKIHRDESKYDLNMPDSFGGMNEANNLSKLQNYLLHITPLLACYKHKLAESYNMSNRDEFLTSLTHESRNLISPLVNMSKLLAQTNLDDNQRDMLSIIQSSCISLLVLTNDILDIARINNNKMTFTDSTFSLRELIEEVIGMMLKKALEKKLDMPVIIDDMTDYIICDRNRLKQIIVNVISNAVKFTNAGSIVTNVSYDKTTEKIVIVIADTGIGINENDQNKLFKAFSQIENKNSNELSGIGAGLHLSKKIALLMGGDLFLKESSNKGSTFQIEIKVKIDELVKPENLNIDGKIITVEEIKKVMEGKTALVVDDNSNNRISICKMLDEFNINYNIAASAEEVYMLFSSKKKLATFDFALIDIVMLPIDGNILVERLYKYYESYNLTQIKYIATNSGLDKISDKFNYQITKPIARKILIRTLLKCINYIPQNSNSPIIERRMSGSPNTHSFNNERLPNRSDNERLFLNRSLSNVEKEQDRERSRLQNSPNIPRLQSQNYSHTTSQLNAVATKISRFNPRVVTGELVNILISEDNANLRIVTEKCLNFIGYKNLNIVKNNLEALECFINNPLKYNFIILDLKTPKMLGSDASKEIKLYCKRYNIKTPILIALTGLIDDTDKEYYMREGMFDHYLTKPMDVDLIKDILSSVDVSTKHTTANHSRDFSSSLS